MRTREHSKTPVLDAINDFNERRDDLDLDIRRFLDKRGWKNTSATPGSIWMHEKEIEGKTYLVDAAMALRIEEWTCGEEEDESET